MAKQRWLFERKEKDGTRRFYLRARVPKDLVQVLGKSVIKKSLRTPDRQIALGRIMAEAAEVQERFDAARRRLAAEPPPPLRASTGRAWRSRTASFGHEIAGAKSVRFWQAF